MPNQAAAPAVTPTAATESSTGPAAGVVRTDALDQDDPEEAPRQAEAPALHQTPQQAAWAALVQALYASADFQFLR